MAYRLRWGALVTLVLAAAVLGAVTALVRSSLIIPVVVALFLAIFILVELVPGWRREPALFSKRAIVVSLLGGVLFAVIVYLLGRTKLKAIISGGAHPWLFLVVVLALFGLVAFLKRLLIRR